MLIFRLHSSNPCQFECVSRQSLGALASCRGLAYGQGVFETLLYRQQPILLNEHLDRLNRGAQALSLNFCPALSRELLNQFLVDKPINGIIKIILVADQADDGLQTSARGYAMPLASNSFLLLQFFPGDATSPEMETTTAIRIKECAYPWPKALAGLKLTASLAYQLWSRKAISQGYQQGILFNEQQELLEGTTANLLLLTSDGDLVTPELRDFGVYGTLRQHLLQKNLITERQGLTEQDIYAARQFYCMNSVRGLIPVSTYAGCSNHQNWRINQSLHVKELTEYLQELFNP